MARGDGRRPPEDAAGPPGHRRRVGMVRTVPAALAGAAALLALLWAARRLSRPTGRPPAAGLPASAERSGGAAPAADAGPRGWADVLALPVILAVALALRLYGIDWDGGALYHPDERAILTHTYDLALPAFSNLGALLDAETSPLNPRWFPYGTLPLYALKALQLALSPVLDLDLVGLSRAGRVLSALADTATVAVTYRLGALLFNRRTGLLAAALVAVAVLHIQLAHFFAAETFQTLFLVSSLYFMAQVVRVGRPRHSLWAGVFVGLAMATKVSSAPILLPLALAHVFAAWRRAGDGEPPAAALRGAALGLAAALGVAAAAFVVTQPYAVLDAGRYLGDVLQQSDVVRRTLDYPYTRQYVDTTPYLYQARQLIVFGLGAPLGIAALGGLAWAIVRTLTRGGAELTLLLAFLVPMLLITGGLEAKFTRYLLPAAPLLTLLGAAMVVSAVDWSRARAPALGRWAAAGAAAFVAATALYALSYAAMYAVPHPAERAAAWLNAAAPQGAVVLQEHWEEGLRGLERHERRELPLYDADTDGKWARITADLAQADYIVLYSSRLFGAISRLPDDYPIHYTVTRGYYRALFAGKLGYELAHVEHKYPSLLGVSLVNDVFTRAGLDPPAGMAHRDPPGLRLPVGYADESFSVYDHPQVLVFANVGRLTEARLADALGIADGIPAPSYDAMLMPVDAWARQQQGGTLRDITPPDGLGARFPLPAWLLAVYAGSLAALPLGLVVFRALPDRGYLLTRPLALLLLAYVPWLLASLGWWGFGRGSIMLAGALTLAVSAWLAYSHRRSLWGFVRQRWRLLLFEEAVFLGAFLAFVLVRAANPDLWHPVLGGEKPMDFAYLNAVLRSTVMPPLDPWFAGGALNYYYFGQFMTAVVIKATGVPSAVAFNLAVPLYFALTLGAAFSLGYNLAEGARRWLRAGARAPGWSALATGGAAAAMTAVLGNLDGAAQVLRGAAGSFNFWSSSRMMPPDPPGFEITEFPFFTFLFADLHAHLMAMPIVLLAVGLSLNTLLLSRRRMPRWRLGVSLAALALAVGALAATNAWDFPTLLALGAASIVAGQWLSARRVTRAMAWRTAGLLAGYLALVVLFWLPYHLALDSRFPGFERSPVTTHFGQYLLIHGLFLYIAVTLLAVELAPRLWRWGGQRAAWTVAGIAAAVLLGSLAALTGYATAFLLTLAALAALALLALWAAPHGWTRPERRGAGGGAAPNHLLPLALLAVALSIGAAVDIVVVGEDIERLNTVFKLYLQAWVFFAVAGAYGLWRIGFVHGWLRTRRPLTALWSLGLALLVAAAAVYPVLGTRDRLDERFAVLPLTLDGMAYMEGAVYQDRAPTPLRWDREAIVWLRDTLEGTPVVLDGRTPLYGWGSRVSVYTGLPTVLGWEWHQVQQRCGGAPCPAVDARARAVTDIYGGDDAHRARDLLREYGVAYVYVGQTERQHYPASGLAKFPAMARAGDLAVVYENPEVVIYRVEGAAYDGAP